MYAGKACAQRVRKAGLSYFQQAARRFQVLSQTPKAIGSMSAWLKQWNKYYETTECLNDAGRLRHDT
eukprot:7036481-Heterocapsa_arctica.AAC.1